jgi:acetyl esterase
LLVTLDPQARMFLEKTAQVPAMDAQPMAVNRAGLEHALPEMTGDGPPSVDVVDGVVTTDVGDVPVRIHRNRSDRDEPAIIYLHGGGWAVGSPALFESTTRAIAHASQAAVISVDYRLAPEHRFPAAVDDAVGVTRAVLRGHVDGVDSTHVAVVGSSAGGNLAAVTAQQLRHEPGLRHQVLIYPVTRGVVPSTGTFAAYAEGYFMTSHDMRFFYANYAPDVPADDPRLAPLSAPDLSGLPPATIITAEFDPLRDDGEDYAAALSEAGVPVTLRRWEGMVPPFVYLGGLFDAAHEARQFIAEQLRRALHDPDSAAGEHLDADPLLAEGATGALRC